MSDNCEIITIPSEDQHIIDKLVDIYKDQKGGVRTYLEYKVQSNKFLKDKSISSKDSSTIDKYEKEVKEYPYLDFSRHQHEDNGRYIYTFSLGFNYKGLEDLIKQGNEDQVDYENERVINDTNVRNLESNSVFRDGEVFYENLDTSVQYTLKSINILQSPKADEIFRKGDKNNWDINKILSELAVPKEQVELIKSFNTRNREEILTSLLANYSFVVEINVATEPIQSANVGYDRFILNGDNYSKIDTYRKNGDKISKEEYGLATEEYKKTENLGNRNTGHYYNLTVPGGTNYIEQEISTPLITPSIKGHAQFATDKGIGWFRSDDQRRITREENEKFNKQEIAELDRQLRNRVITVEKYESELSNLAKRFKKAIDEGSKTRRVLEVQSDLFQKGRDKSDLTSDKVADVSDWINQNQFLQLLNKNNNWVTFFVKSIIQSTAKQTITEVQQEDVEAKVRELEKEGLLEIDCKGKLKAEKGLAASFTKGGKWKVIKDLKGYPTHKEGGVDLTIDRNGVSIKNGNTQFIAKHGLVIPKN